jgi:hypothetical protein
MEIKKLTIYSAFGRVKDIKPIVRAMHTIKYRIKKNPIHLTSFGSTSMSLIESIGVIVLNKKMIKTAKDRKLTIKVFFESDIRFV